MTSLRARYRQYWVTGGIPDTPEWYEGTGDLRAAFGAGVVLVVGTGIAIPLTLHLVQLLRPAFAGLSWVVEVALWLGVGLVMMELSGYLAVYLAAPLADHLLGVPREVEA